MHTPCKPLVYCIKVEFKGAKAIQACFHDDVLPPRYCIFLSIFFRCLVKSVLGDCVFPGSLILYFNSKRV